MLWSGCPRLTEPLAVDGGAMLIVSGISCNNVEDVVDVTARKRMSMLRWMWMWMFEVAVEGYLYTASDGAIASLACERHIPNDEEGTAVNCRAITSNQGR